MKSIGLKITVIMLCVILFGIVVTVGISMLISGSAIVKESTEKAQYATEGQALIMDEWLTYHKASANAAASAISRVNDYSKESLQGILRSLLNDNSVYQDFYMGFPDNTAVMGSGFAIEDEYAKGWRATERSWYQLAMQDINNAGVTPLYVDTATGDLCISVARAVVKDGNVVGVVAIDILVNVLQDITFSSSLDPSGYAMLVNSNGDILIHPDNTLAPDTKGNFNNLATVRNGFYSDLWNNIASGDGVYKFKDANGVPSFFASCTLSATGWRMVTVLPTKVVMKPITDVVVIVVPTTVVILILAGLLIFITTKNAISKPLTPVVAFFSKYCDSGDITLTQKDIETINTYSSKPDEIGRLIYSASSFVKRISEVSDALETVAGGDLTVEFTPLSEKDKLGLSVREMSDSMNHMFGEINTAAGQFVIGAKQIADAAQALAQGSTEQAASIEELSSSITDISLKTKANAGMAEKAATLADTIKSNAEKGTMQMNDMMGAVNEINDASGSISKVIKVIDDIAFQTNILALNAAVEAARAGQHGKGFAVVAEEVRNLAAKSAEAAKETGSLIENSIEKANLGVRIAGETAESLAGIVSGINESSQLVGEIARSSEEQSMGITQINTGIDQVAQVVQHNSATAEEEAAASEEMSSQAALLRELVAQMRLRDNGGQLALPFGE
ncbi:MAG: methyl-accepting chemotaxis protein [Oscillospiraceae bacterium]|nr:methyl-accepting chemotaxis protein [Oscillospiraceae bacterium]